MTVIKNRYLVMEMLCEGEGPALSQTSLSNAIKDSLLLTFGEIGLGSSLTSLQVKYVNPVTKLCIIRCSRFEYEKIWCAITFITSIGSHPCFFNLLDLSGNIRCCKRTALEYDRKKLSLLMLKGARQVTSEQIDLADACMQKISRLDI